MLATGLIAAEPARAAMTCYASNTTATDYPNDLNFPGVGWDGVAYGTGGWLTYGTIAQQFRTAVNATVNTVRLYDVSVTGNPGTVKLGVKRTTYPDAYYPYWTYFPLGVAPEGEATITAGGPANDWTTYRLNVPVDLTAATVYALQMQVPFPLNPPPPPTPPPSYWSVRRYHYPAPIPHPPSAGRIVYWTSGGWGTMADEASVLFFEVCHDPDVTYQSVTTTTGGSATLVPDTGALGSVTPTPVPTYNRPAVGFPYGMFDFTISGLDPGGTAVLTLTFSRDIPVGSKWWKYLGSGNWLPLDIGSDDGDNVITVALQDGGPGDMDGAANGSISDPGGIGVPNPVDLDITALRAPKGATTARPVAVKLVVKNAGAYDGPRPATLIGLQNGVEVYRETIDVSDPAGGGGSRYEFPSYLPTASGPITWTVTLFDDQDDIDTATAVTVVK